MIRQRLLRSWLGQAALALRDRWRLLATPQEALGTAANDQLAFTLLPGLLPRGGGFVDVGAHIGSVTATMRRHDPSATILAIEPMPDKAERLRTTFPGIAVEACAIGEREGEVAFHVDAAHTGLSSLAPGEGRTRSIAVAMRTLDALTEARRIDLIKIDVEGAELGVLRGAPDLLAAARPLILFESGPEDVLGYTKEALWRLFDASGYALFVPNRIAHEAPPLSLDGFLDSHLYPRRTTNYFAIPTEKIGDARRRAREILGI